MQELKKNVDAWIRAGDFASAQAAIDDIDAKKLPRSQLVTFCQLATRANLWRASLAVLRPLIRPVNPGQQPASPEEKLEYAIALQRAGALSESTQLLSEIRGVRMPKIFLVRAYGQMAKWNYAAALEELVTYLSSGGLTEYEHLIGQVNQLACLVFLERDDAAHLIPKLQKTLQTQKFFLLLGNVLEISAQYWIARGEFGLARTALADAETLLAKEGGINLIYAEKWSLILDAVQSKSEKRLESLRAKARKQGNWEVLRDLDYFQTAINPDCPWAKWVYFGTPFESFRKRLEKIRSFPNEEWIGRNPSAPIKIDPWFPGSLDGEFPHRLVVFLLRDFYQPVSGGEIFSNMYPDEHFNIASSLNKVRQIVNRTRTWIKKMNYPFVLREDGGQYSLRVTDECRLLIRKQELPTEKLAFIFARFPEKPELSVSEWAEKLGFATTKVQHLLSQAQDSGVVRMIGGGRYAHYQLR